MTREVIGDVRSRCRDPEGRQRHVLDMYHNSQSPGQAIKQDVCVYVCWCTENATTLPWLVAAKQCGLKTGVNENA